MGKREKTDIRRLIKNAMPQEDNVNGICKAIHPTDNDF